MFSSRRADEEVREDKDFQRMEILQICIEIFYQPTICDSERCANFGAGRLRTLDECLDEVGQGFLAIRHA